MPVIHIIAAMVLLVVTIQPVGGQSLLSVDRAQAGNMVTVTLFADGTARTALTEGGDDGASGTGSLGLRLGLPGWAVAANVSVVSSVDSINDGFGSAVLNPAGGSNPSGIVDLYIHQVAGWPVGLHAYTSFSQSIWAREGLGARVGTLGAGVLASYEVAGQDAQEHYGIRFEAGLSYRSIGGDISSRDDLRVALLGTSDKTFPGVEGGVQITANHVTAGFQAYYLKDAEDDVQVEGLTRFQMTFGLRVEGAIVTKALTRKP